MEEYEGELSYTYSKQIVDRNWSKVVLVANLGRTESLDYKVSWSNDSK